MVACRSYVFSEPLWKRFCVWSDTFSYVPIPEDKVPSNRASWSFLVLFYCIYYICVFGASKGVMLLVRFESGDGELAFLLSVAFVMEYSWSAGCKLLLLMFVYGCSSSPWGNGFSETLLSFLTGKPSVSTWDCDYDYASSSFFSLSSSCCSLSSLTSIGLPSATACFKSYLYFFIYSWCCFSSSVCYVSNFLVNSLFLVSKCWFSFFKVSTIFICSLIWSFACRT